MFIPEDKVEEVRAATDIVEVVGEYVRLKRRGSNFIGLCPFHQEKTPSFNVNPDMGIFKCFGCGAGGNGFQFLMRIENLEFVETVQMLAQRAGISLPDPKEDRREHSEVEAIHHALRFAGKFYYEALTKSEDGKVGLDYLLNRGYTVETIKKYGLGFAPAEWDALLKAAAAEPIKPEVLNKAGLVIYKQERDRYYDRYRGRVVFPIFSHVGKVIGFGGRILEKSDNQPKYINSPETRVYHKSRVLYGLYQAKSAIRKREEVILVEGYTDVISLHQAGIEHAVATSGTALTPDQIKLLSRYAQRVLVLYDADSAGAKAALRGIDLLLEHGLTVYGLELPEGEDPDSFVREQGGTGFENYTETHRKDFVEFIYHVARRNGQLASPEGQGRITRSIIASIARMPDLTMHEPFVRRASHILGVPDIRLFEALSESIRDQRRNKRKPQAPPSFEEAYAVAQDPSSTSEAPLPIDEAYGSFAKPARNPLPEEKMLLRLMLDHGHAMVEFIMGNMAMEEFTPGPVQDAIQALLKQYEAGKIDKHRLVDGSFGDAVKDLVTEVLVDQHEPSKNWERRKNINVPRLNEDPAESAASTMTQLKLDRVKQALDVLKQEIYQAQRNDVDVRPLLEERMALHTLQRQIEQREFITWNS